MLEAVGLDLGQISANDGGLNATLGQGEVEGTHLFLEELAALSCLLVSRSLPANQAGYVVALARDLVQLGAHCVLFYLEGRPVDCDDC